MKKICNNKYILLLCWLGFFLSINMPLTINHYYIKNNVDFQILTIINFFRIIGPFLILFFIIFTFFLLKKKFSKVYKNNFLKVFFIFFSIQIISFFVYGENIIEFFYYPFVSLILLAFMIQTNTFKNSNILWQAMHALIWLLMINCTIVIFQTANELYGNLTVESITYNYYNATTLGPHSRIYDSPAPRSTGISRQLLLIHFFYFFYRREIKNIPYKLFSLLILFASAYFVIAMQSRSSLYFLIFFYTFFLFFFYNISLDKKILLLCSFLLMPYLLSGYEKGYRVQIVIDKEYEKKVLEKEKIVKINPRVLKGLNRNKEKIIQDNKIATKNDSINKGTKPKIFSKKKEDRSFNERLFGLDNPVGNLFEKEKKTSKNLNSEYVQKYKKLQKTTGNRIFVKSTSGRTGLWKKSLDLIQKRPWFGYGPMSDRLLIKENVSNMFLYTLLSGGLFGFLILLYLIISISSMIYRLVFNFKIFKYNDHYPSYLSISVLYLGFLLIRGMVENSFSIYSLDFMVFCISSTLINNYLQRLKK